jgi:CHAD domain-containing protein
LPRPRFQRNFFALDQVPGTMKPDRFFRRWQRRQTRLLAESQALIRQCRAHGDAEQVHQLRVVLRRLRLFARLGRPLLDPAAVAAFRRWARGLSKALSLVRDLDVALEWLTTFPGVDAALVAACQQRRERCWRPARDKLSPLPVGVLAALSEVRGGQKRAAALAERAERIEAKLRAAVKAALPHFLRLPPAEQHAFRRTVRWWRYRRELALPRRKLTKDRLLRLLIAVQEATGNEQNRALAVHALSETKSPAAAPLLARLECETKSERETITAMLRSLARSQGWRVSQSKSVRQASAPQE